MAGKRKRESMDQGRQHVPPPPHGDFRASPNAGPLIDFDPSQYVNSHHESDMPPHFADALVQHNAGDHSIHHGDSNTGQNATDTASAALHYSINIHQTGEEAFLQDVAAEAQRRRREPSDSITFGETSTHQPEPNPYAMSPFDQAQEPPQQPERTQIPAAQHPQQPQQPTPTPTGPEQSPPLGGGPSTPNRPAVGTDAWHKVRKDNHKEGKCCRPLCDRPLMYHALIFVFHSGAPTSRDHQ